MTELADVINVTVNVADTKITRAGFGVPLILDEFLPAVFAERVREYPNLAAVAVDFADTTKVYKAANAIFAQERAPTKIKVGRIDSGDASTTTALDNIEAEDPDWYCIVSVDKTLADILLVAAWVETRSKIFLAANQDAAVIAVGSADIASQLQALAYNHTAFMWHHQCGVDVTGAGYTVTSNVATINKVAHGLAVGDPVTFSSSSGISIDGNAVVASVVDVDNFTTATTAADEAGPDTVDYFANYTFPEAAWVGYMLPSDPGSETWKFKTLTGVVPVPRTTLNPTEEATALGKNANLYTLLAGVGATLEGVMNSGRFIDIQRSTDWIEARLAEAIATRLLNSKKVPYTDAGGTVFEGDMAQVIDEGVRKGVLGLLLDDSGDYYRIVIPKVADQSVGDRNIRYFPGATIEGQFAGAVHKLAVTVNAQV